MAVISKSTTPSPWLDPFRGAQSDPVGTSGAGKESRPRAATVIVVLLAAVLWSLWLFADMLLQIAY